MSELIVRGEPNPGLPPVRAFRGYPGFDVKFRTLSTLRAAMVEDDIVIVESLAKRNARGRAAEQEYLALRTETFPDGFRRSFNLAHCMPDVFAQAQKRHPYEEGLVTVLEQVYPEIATPTSPPVQLYDFPIIDAIAARLNKAKQATVFKADRAEGLAPLTQAANIQRAVDMASLLLPDDPEFANQVERLYGKLVSATVAVQQTMFDRTYRLDDWDGVGFRGIEPVYS